MIILIIIIVELVGALLNNFYTPKSVDNICFCISISFWYNV